MKKLAILLLLGGVFLWAQPSQAGLVGIQISDGTNTVTCFDGQGCDAAGGTAGAVTFIGTIGVWTFNVTTAQGYPLSGSPTNLVMDLNSVNTSSTSATTSTLTIEMTQQDYADGGSPNLKSWNGGIGGTTDGTLTAQKWVDDLNYAFFTTADACSALIANLGPFSGGPFSGSATGSYIVGKGLTGGLPSDCNGPNNSGVYPESLSSGSGLNTYSMTDLVTITHAAGTHTTSFDFSDHQVPEPTSMVLLGMGLVGLAAWGRKRLVHR